MRPPTTRPIFNLPQNNFMNSEDQLKELNRSLRELNRAEAEVLAERYTIYGRKGFMPLTKGRWVWRSILWGLICILVGSQAAILPLMAAPWILCIIVDFILFVVVAAFFYHITIVKHRLDDKEAYLKEQAKMREDLLQKIENLQARGKN